MLRLLFIASLFLYGIEWILAQTGEITGQVKDEAGVGVPFANVAAEQGGAIISGTSTDFDGYFTIKPLNPGVYDIRVSYIGYSTSLTQGVQVSSDQIRELTISVKPEETVLGVIDIVEYKVPLIDKENNSTKNTITKEEIAALPTRDVNSIASTSAGVYQEDEGGSLNIKGARSDGTEYYIDGVRVRGSTKIPAQAIEQMTVVTGGVPAKYGNATGGIITITTRGPSRTFGGSFEGATSQGMDAYGFNLATFNLTGPVIKKNKGTNEEKTIVGFFVAGEYLRHKDADPSAVGLYKAKDDVLRDLEQNPLVPSPVSDAFIVATETVTRDQLEKIKSKENVAENNYSLTGKLDFRVTDDINLTFGGSMDYVKRHEWVDRYSMFNYINNPLYNENTWRVYGRFTQRFSQKAALDAEQGISRSAFQNAFYMVQVDFTKVYDKREDESHGFNPFDYGYLGNYNIHKAPIYDYSRDETSEKTGWRQIGYRDTLVEFAPSDVNPTTTNFTDKYYQLAGAEFVNGVWTSPESGAQTGFYESLDQILINNGMLNGDRPRVPHDIWFNTGRQFDGYGVVSDNDQYRLAVSGSVDILRPGTASRNKHALEFGFEFEQRVDRGYSIIPIGLWGLMRQLTNSHIAGLDENNPILRIDGENYNYNDPNLPAFGMNDTILYNRLYVAGQQSNFDRSLRRSLGLADNNTDFINTDGLTPDTYSLDMFSADELLNNGNPFVSYFGYDYLGNKLNSQPSFDDYFKKKDANGNFTREIGAYRPIYTAAFIQDKFNLKDLLFNIGFRVDRFDANQKVLRDRYSLYQAYTVNEARDLVDGEIPSNMGNDYVVYVDDFNKTNPIPLGYRNGDIWFNSEGEEVTNAEIIAGSSTTGRITPYLVNPSDNIKSEDFEPSTAFEDYEPQITFMPRIAFSFNITDEASFFAHYDVLTQRPQSRILSTPDDWYYFEEIVTDRVLNNPNLKPEKTIDYQVGFRQLVTRNSAITLSAFYREMKDMIQVVNVQFAYPRTYRTFGNVDFGTVKGFSLAFDLRKTQTSNLSLKANYTIQWAEGTGSNNTSQLNLVGAGQPNLRTIVPLSYDSRHNINLTIDYSYGEGSNYNGPKIKGKDILANAGVNVIARARSGEPFTAQANPTAEALRAQATRTILEGSINGSRLPWNFRVDMRVFKDFNLRSANKEGARPLYLNVYLLIQNLLNTQNITRVYSFTGSPDDDGYLASSLGQQDLESQINAQSYEDLYRAFITHPNNFSRPRQVRLGAIFSF